MQRLIYKLDDSVIAQIVKLIQLGFLTMTDVSDHMRQIRLEVSSVNNHTLVLTPEYVEKDKADLERTLADLEKLRAGDNK